MYTQIITNNQKAQSASLMQPYHLGSRFIRVELIPRAGVSSDSQ